MRLGIIGGGRAGWAIGSAWQKSGGTIVGVALRDGSSSGLPAMLNVASVLAEELLGRSDAVCVAVTDSALPSIAAQLSDADGKAALFHLSGSLPADVLAPHEPRFSLHPLRSLPPVGAAVSLEGTLLVFEGPEEARAPAREIVSTLRGRWLEISASKKPLYHAGAVIGSNLVASLLETAALVLGQAGIERDAAGPAIASLAGSAIDNWINSSAPNRFTGPAARADLGTLEANIHALGRQDWKEIYRLLSLVIVDTLAETGHDPRYDAIAAWLRDHPFLP